MDDIKKRAIQGIVNASIVNFASGLKARHNAEAEDPNGVINSKKKNCFMAVLGDEMIFYSAFCRSFDSSFGNVLENMGNEIAKLSFDVRGRIESYRLPQQDQHIEAMLTAYSNHDKAPEKSDYIAFNCVKPKDITSFKMTHETDNYFYDSTNKVHYIIELKAGGDLDNKKAKAEKSELLREYFMLKNSIAVDEEVIFYLATAYNMYGEGQEWNQTRVLQYFSKDELLIGKDYWNFVCQDEDGFDVVMAQYKIAAEFIKNTIRQIRDMYR